LRTQLLQSVADSTAEQFAARCIWFASVVGYGKCFVAAEGRRVILDKQDVRLLGSQFVECHDQLMADRHEYIAHGGTSLNEASRFGLAVERLEPLQLMQVNFGLQSYLPCKDHLARARDLCARLADEVMRRVTEACDSWEAEVRKIPIEELRRALAPMMKS
jgi:hypothetical protein